MNRFFVKAISGMYIFIFPDSKNESRRSTRYKLFVVLLVLLLFSTTAYTLASLNI